MVSLCPEQKGKAKTLSYRLEELEVTLACPHGTLVIMPRIVAGVDPFSLDSDGNEVFVEHKVENIDSSMVVACHYKQIRSLDEFDPSKISCLDKTEQDSDGLYALGDQRTEDYVDGMVVKNSWRIEEGSSIPLLKNLFRKGLVIATYKWDDAELTQTVHSLIKNKLFAQRHKSRNDKIAYWSTGGPAHCSRVMEELLSHEVFVEYFKTLACVLPGGMRRRYKVFHVSSKSLDGKVIKLIQLKEITQPIKLNRLVRIILRLSIGK
jgi:hypothetical protein